MASIFSRIVAGEIPSYKIAETADYLAFLDVNPRREGHTLVIPKQEVNYVFDVEDATYTGLWQFAKRVAKAIEQVVPCERVGVAVIGLEVPHTHIHLIPIDKVSDINFERPPVSLTPEKFVELSTAIAAVFQ